MSVRRWFRKRIGRPVTNREREVERYGFDGALAYLAFEQAVLEETIAALPCEGRLAARHQFGREWGEWLDAPYEPGSVFSPTHSALGFEVVPK